MLDHKTIHSKLKLFYKDADQLPHFTLFTSSLLLSPIIQKGPTCGLVAFLMSLKAFKINTTIEQLIIQAQEWKLSNKGEVFSSTKFSKFINETFSELQSKVYEWKTVLDLFHVFEELEKERKEAFLIVPYDQDYNFYPTENEGMKAHWMIVQGFIFPSLSADTQNERITPYKKENEKQLAHITAEELFVLGYQGHSKHTCCFKISDLFKSNGQLRYARVDHGEYILPISNGRIDGPDGLCSKFIVIIKDKA